VGRGEIDPEMLWHDGRLSVVGDRDLLAMLASIGSR